MEIKEGDDKDGEKQGAVDAGSVEEVGSGDEEYQVDWGCICA